MGDEVRTSAGDRITLEFVGIGWWKLRIDTGDYERVIDLNETDLGALSELLSPTE